MGLNKNFLKFFIAGFSVLVGVFAVWFFVFNNEPQGPGEEISVVLDSFGDFGRSIGEPGRNSRYRKSGTAHFRAASAFA